MPKIGFLLVLLASLGANADILTLLNNLTPSQSELDQLRQLSLEINNTLMNFQQLVSDGIYVKPTGFDDAVTTNIVNITGLPILSAGIVTLPTQFLCSQTGMVENVACRIGTIDCIYAHNRYSGKCANSPNPVNGTNQMNGVVFVCNDQQPTGYDFTDISDPNNCGVLISPLIAGLFDVGMRAVVRTRFATDLCQGENPNFSSVGCSSDCRNNHQYASGLCVNNAQPVDIFTGELNPQFQCNCSLTATA